LQNFDEFERWLRRDPATEGWQNGQN